jgi:hypothetical protein
MATASRNGRSEPEDPRLTIRYGVLAGKRSRDP